MSNWIAFFSQTGNEIVNLSDKLGIEPKLIITNKQTLDIKSKVYLKFKNKIWYLPNKPTIIDYQRIFKILDIQKEDRLTLHGYLRIIPPIICEEYNIINLHPGLITKYPELKGFNPQEKAYNLNHEVIGSVIHKVSPIVDDGEILISNYIKGKDTLDETYSSLAELSLSLWYNYLTNISQYENSI